MTVFLDIIGGLVIAGGVAVIALCIFHRPGGDLKKPMRSTMSKEQRAACDEVRQGYIDGTVSTEEAASLYLAILYATGPVRGSFGDYDRSKGRCHHMAPYPGCGGGCS